MEINKDIINIKQAEIARRINYIIDNEYLGVLFIHYFQIRIQNYKYLVFNAVLYNSRILLM